MSWDYFYIFWQSSLLETAVFYLFYRKSLRPAEILVLVTAANAITHPIVFFGFMASPMNYLTAILLAELFAISGETVLHRWAAPLSLRRAFIAATVANLVSWQLAPAITYWLFLAG